MIRHLTPVICLTLLAACGGEASSVASPGTATPAPIVTPMPQADRLEALDGPEWIVTAIGDVPAAEGFVARLRFVNGNEIGGQIACNGLFLEYEIDGSVISLTIDHQRTIFNCVPELDPEDQGDHVYEALEQMASFTATESSLELFDGNGTLLLVFDRFLPPPLDPALEGDWAVTTLHGEAPIGDAQLSLTISYQSIDGFSGCNAFGGPRSPLATNALAIEWIETDDAGCPEPPGLQDQEAAYQSAVGQADSYLVDGDMLKLLDADGNVLVELEHIPDVAMNPANLVAHPDRWGGSARRCRHHTDLRER